MSVSSEIVNYVIKGELTALARLFFFSGSIFRACLVYSKELKNIPGICFLELKQNHERQ